MKTIMLEVPQQVSKEELSDFLHPFSYTVARDPIPLDRSDSIKNWIYVLQGPQELYASLEKAVQTKPDFALWSNSGISLMEKGAFGTFGPAQ